MKKPKFVIFLHGGTYDKLHQAATIGLTAAAMGKEVYVFLMFWAIKKLASGEIDTGLIAREGDALMPNARPSEEALADALDNLPGLERKVLVLRYGLDGAGERRANEVARSLGLSVERVRRVEDGALAKLRGLPEAQSLREEAA